jgi:ubiquitin-conjugating enzyme (huntingtin interacting protein 2)
MALISLRMLLESPNPKDPQDAQVATQLLQNPEIFAVEAHSWAVKYAGAPRQEEPAGKYKKTGAEAAKVATNDPNK